MSPVRFSVVILPKLDNEPELQLLRERYDPRFYQIRPHITLVQPFTPATLDEIQNVSDHVSRVRRKLHPVRVVFRGCQEAGDRLFLTPSEGRETLVDIHREITGSDQTLLIPDAGFDPWLLAARVPDATQRSQARVEIDRLLRTIGIVDALALVEVDLSGELRLVANYPFGIARVDHYGRFNI